MTAMNGARRATLYPTADGWTAKVQGQNWRTLDVYSATRQATVLRRIETKYPGIEIVVAG